MPAVQASSIEEQFKNIKRPNTEFKTLKLAVIFANPSLITASIFDKLAKFVGNLLQTIQSLQ